MEFLIGLFAGLGIGLICGALAMLGHDWRR